MYPRSHRLSLASNWKDVKQSGKTLKLPHLTVILTPNNLGHIRLGTLITKKIHKKAVWRNTLKRKIIHAAKDCLESTLSLDLIVIPYPSALMLTYHQLTEILTKLQRLLRYENTHHNNN